MKGNFDVYVLWPLDKMVQNWIVDWSTARDFTVNEQIWDTLLPDTRCNIELDEKGSRRYVPISN